MELLLILFVKRCDKNTTSETFSGEKFNTGVTMMWSHDSDRFYVFNTSDYFQMGQKYIISYDVYSGKINKTGVAPHENYVVAGISRDGQEIICTNADSLPGN